MGNEEVRTIDLEGMERYEFSNVEEFIAYAKIYKPGAKVSWIQGDSYINQLKTGIALFDKEEYQKAIGEYKKCFEFNPIALVARFEIVECYIALGQLDAALNELLGFSYILLKNEDIARWFRRYGYVQTELGNYELAFASYAWSYRFEQNPSVIQEFAYIEYQSGKDLKHIDVKGILEKQGLNLFEKPIRFDNPEDGAKS